MTFEEWKEAVNKEVISLISLGCDDLPDVDYMTMYEDYMNPKEAAEEVLDNAFPDWRIINE